MSIKKVSERYVLFLRGINVGGHHKVPMLELKKALVGLGFENIITLLNSGNVIFDTPENTNEYLESIISDCLERIFGFPIPTIVRHSQTIERLINDAPFQDVNVTKDIRLYISFLKKESPSDLKLPWTSADNSYKIIEIKDQAILSILDVSLSQTTKAMEIVEKSFGKDITTRNWNTIERIGSKL